ncbi:MAG: hypothetical protein H6Q70_2070 [Firmicutes bacterium]|nr:hypothetical protein [Bacillota bacterium]
MQMMYASEYATHSGYPLLTIKTFCKDGILPYDRIGRKYLIDVAIADEILKNRRVKNQSANETNDKVIKFESKKQKTFDFLAEINKLQRQG